MVHLLTKVASHFTWSYSQHPKNAMGLTTALLKVGERNTSNLRWGPGTGAKSLFLCANHNRVQSAGT